MKRKILVGALASSVAVGGAVGASALSDSITSTTSSKAGLEVDSEMESQAVLNTNKLIGVEELQDIVLSEVEGTIEEVELETKGEMNAYFEVEVHQDTKQFEVFVDAYNGKILKVEESDKSVSGEAKVEQDTNARTETSVTKDSQTNTESKAKTNLEANTETNTKTETDENEGDHVKSEKSVISKEKAINIALEVAAGKVSEIELEESDHGLIYNVELKGTIDTEIKVDAYTGSVLGLELD